MAINFVSFRTGLGAGKLWWFRQYRRAGVVQIKRW